MRLRRRPARRRPARRARRGRALVARAHALRLRHDGRGPRRRRRRPRGVRRRPTSPPDDADVPAVTARAVLVRLRRRHLPVRPRRRAGAASTSTSPSRPGAFLGVVGPSGSGKTHPAAGVMGTMRPAAGAVYRAAGPARRLRAPGRDGELGLPGHRRRVRAHGPHRADVACRGRAGPSGPRSTEVLERLGIADLGGRHIRELSGGQQQRVFLARALLRRPAAAAARRADLRRRRRSTRHEVLHLLDELNADGLAIVLTTHDLNGIAAHLPTLVCLNRDGDRRRPARGRCSPPTCSSEPTAPAWRCWSTAACRSSSTRSSRPTVIRRGRSGDGRRSSSPSSSSSSATA